MPLETLEGLPEEVANLYKKGEDGKFHLEGSDGLKSALQKERERANTAEKALKDKERAESEEKTKKEQEEAKRRGDFDKLQASLEARLAEKDKELQDTRTAHEIHLKETRALTLLGPLAATPKTLESLKRDFVDQLEVVEGKVLVKGDPALTPEKLAEKFQKNPEYAPFLKGTGANGGGAPQPGNGGAPTDNDKKTGTQLIREGLEAGLLGTK